MITGRQIFDSRVAIGTVFCALCAVGKRAAAAAAGAIRGGCGTTSRGSAMAFPISPTVYELHVRATTVALGMKYRIWL